MRTRAGKQFVEYSAQRIHIGGDVYRLASYLFGAGVFRRQQGHAESSSVVVVNTCFVIEQLADTEIEQFGFTLRVDEDVSGLQVAMHHELQMGIVDWEQTRRNKRSFCS